jgi:hypothetical protein
MLISVTQEDIEKGTIDGENCPIALAAKRVIGGMPFVSVDESFISIDDEDYRLPTEASQFVGDFDGNAKVSPFSFELPL